MAGTREPQYQSCVDFAAKRRRSCLGLMSNEVWHNDPRRLAFVLARYKFISKRFSGMDSVLEVGCADAFATRIVLQEVGGIVAVDFDPIFVEDVQQRMDPDWKIDCRVHDMLDGPVSGKFDGAYAVDVLEHIAVDHENVFLGNIVASLKPDGVLIVGVPSLQSQAYASTASRAGHVNCKDGDGLRRTLERFFHNVFIFSMNDEVVHTGFSAMAHYLFGLCCGPRNQPDK